MKPPRVQVGGRPLELDRLIGRGGEGEVYLVAGDPTQAVKLYTTPDRLSREDKIAAMVQSELAKRSPLAAFPHAVVHSRDGTFAGFFDATGGQPQADPRALRAWFAKAALSPGRLQILG